MLKFLFDNFQTDIKKKVKIKILKLILSSKAFLQLIQKKIKKNNQEFKKRSNLTQYDFDNFFNKFFFCDDYFLRYFNNFSVQMDRHCLELLEEK